MYGRDTISAILYNLNKRIHNCTTPTAKYEHSGGLRVDALSWVAIALRHAQPDNKFIVAAQKGLAASQMTDGSIPVIKSQPNATWPTSLAIISWSDDLQFSSYLKQAVQYTLKHSGEHWNPENDSEGHDPSIIGWPWISGTHSWVEPTALAIIALDITGNKDHPRVTQGIHLLMDRQLQSGGWNYGNTRVFGSRLYPAPESTAIALSALANKVPEKDITMSIQYLKDKLKILVSPISLGWTLLGLNAWNIKIENKTQLIQNCLDRQKDFGCYSVQQLSLLLLANCTTQGILKSLKKTTDF